MTQKILIFLALLVLLAACRRQQLPAVQQFEGQTVATLQTPGILDDLAATPESNLPAQPAQDGTIAFTATAPADLASGTENNPGLPYSGGEQTGTPTMPPFLGDPVWAGTWNIWYQQTSGNYAPSTLTLEVDDSQISGMAKINATDYLFKGTILPGQKEVEGTWSAGEHEGKFWWQIDSEHIFVGSWDGRFGFCGNRESTMQPQNCRKIQL